MLPTCFSEIIPRFPPEEVCFESTKPGLFKPESFSPICFSEEVPLLRETVVGIPSIISGDGIERRIVINPRDPLLQKLYVNFCEEQGLNLRRFDPDLRKIFPGKAPVPKFNINVHKLHDCALRRVDLQSEDVLREKQKSLNPGETYLSLCENPNVSYALRIAYFLTKHNQENPDNQRCFFVCVHPKRFLYSILYGPDGQVLVFDPYLELPAHLTGFKKPKTQKDYLRNSGLTYCGNADI